MKDKVIFILGISSYVISFLLITIYLFMEFSVLNVVSPMDRLKILFLIFIFLYIGCVLLYKENHSKKFKLGKFNLWILFLLYMVMLLNMMLFDSYFGRFNGTNYLLDFTNFESRFGLFTNLVPFDTIRNYFVALSNGNIGFGNFLYNILGNVIAFMQLAFFVPKLIRVINKSYKYFIFASCLIVFIECMQFVFNVGTLDIDDYILNIFGSMLFYYIVKIKLVNKAINKVLYLEN